jgi:hypothetical protein
LEILQQGANEEHLPTVGQTRVEETGKRKPGIFTAAAYYWMYYAPAPGRDLEIVKPGEHAGPGQCHAVLDPLANLDGDSVSASNSTYEFAGIDAERPELLYRKTFTCACSQCREPTSIGMLRYGCPFEVYTGRWRQQTVYAAKGVVRAAAHKRMEARDFARQVRAEQLYAVYGSYYERGGQPYWLLWCRKAPYKAMPGLKYPDGSAIRTGTWIIKAYWFAATSESRRSYKLLDDQEVCVKVESLIQEHGLRFDREAMHDRILSAASHLALMRYNYSNVLS